MTQSSIQSLPPDICDHIKPYDRNIWVGYLTPSEIKILLDAGCIAEPRSRTIVERIGSKFSPPPTLRWWFYFVPHPALGLKSDGPFKPMKFERDDA